MPITLDDLRRFAVRRSLFPPTTLKRAVHRMGFIQADPIRAPARAQDLTLRHRVNGYRVGDLDRAYQKLGIEEDLFIVYGFVTRSIYELMHPREAASQAGEGRRWWSPGRRRQVQSVLEFVRQRGAVHPREVDEYFSHGTVRNAWGGISNATTHLMEAMHYRGMLRVVRRERGIRIYTAHEHGLVPAKAAERQTRVDALVDAVVQIYAPLPAPSLATIVRRLRYAVPQWTGELSAAIQRAKQRLARARIDGVDWYWPAAEEVAGDDAPEAVRLLTPFDPVVWDRARFELLWGWAYRFEAYTPPLKRKLGYYALPLLWRDRVIGWGNLSVRGGELESEFGYIALSPPRSRAFAREREAELERMRTFLRLDSPRPG